MGRTDYLLKNRLANRAWVVTQDPVILNERSEPEPDISVLKIDPLDYADHHPTPSEVYLIIEVANSSLKLDTETKALAYSQAGIKDYWVLDVVKRELHIFRNPMETGYHSHLILTEHGTVSPLDFLDLEIAISDMLPLETSKK